MSSTDNRRIAKNVIVLYIRMLFIMAITLYTSRIVLNALGIVDYGVYNAVGGFILMFSILSSSLSVAISRYITFELGKENHERLRQIFSSSMLMLLSIGLMVLILIESVGVWFLNAKMTIPRETIQAANWVLQFSAITFIINLISVPYNAAIIAHEKMKAFAFISVFEAVGKLAIGLSLFLISSKRLILYAVLLCVLSLIIRLIYYLYCKRNFNYTKIEFKIEKNVAKEIFAFSGWNFIGSSAGILKDQGVNVLINIFCGPAVNAGRGIAMQVSHAMQNFTNSFTTAINPQITKNYALGNREDWTQLVLRGSRFSCYLLILISIPIYVKALPILQIWLGEIPPYALVFTRLIIINMIVDTLSYTLITLMLATGNIRNYQLLVGGVQLLNFPISWIILNNGFSPAFTIIVSIFLSFVGLSVRLLMLRKMVNFDIKDFLYSVLWKVILVFGISLILAQILDKHFNSNILQLMAFGVISIIWTSIVIFYLGCTKSEKTLIIKKITRIL